MNIKESWDGLITKVDDKFIVCDIVSSTGEQCSPSFPSSDKNNKRILSLSLNDRFQYTVFSDGGDEIKFQVRLPSSNMRENKEKFKKALKDYIEQYLI